MTRLNDEALTVLSGYDVTPNQWIKHHGHGDEWGGDECGCPDDRCIGHHHLADEPCGCLRMLLNEYVSSR
ncbi:MAG: hypothetical protein L0G69_12170 [Brevibacterium sp.]|nr:hypothetical protein [Brevibacterium sp.]